MKTTESINSLTRSDEIIATIEYNGHQVASLSRKNFACVDEVVRTLVTLAGNFVGLAKLHIRNKTQGWNMLMGVASHQRRRQPLLASESLPSLAAGAAASWQGRQLSIPW